MPSYLNFLTLFAAISNLSVAISFGVSFMTDENFTVLQPRVHAESAVGVAFAMFLWVAIHAALFIAILIKDEGK